MKQQKNMDEQIEFIKSLRNEFIENTEDGVLLERGIGDFSNEYVYWLEELIYDCDKK